MVYICIYIYVCIRRTDKTSQKENFFFNTQYFKDLAFLSDTLALYSPTTALTVKQTTRTTTGSTPRVRQEEPPAAWATISTPCHLLRDHSPPPPSPPLHTLHTELADHLGNIQPGIPRNHSILENHTSQGVFLFFPFVFRSFFFFLSLL